MKLLLDLPADVLAPRVVRGAFEAFSPIFPLTFVDDARLLTNELVTNAIKHGGLGPSDNLEVWAHGTPERLRVEVVGGKRPFGLRPAPSAPDGTSGWGLLLVGSLSNRWGYWDGGETAVWFEMDRVRRRSRESLPPEPSDRPEGWNGVGPRRRRKRSSAAS